MRRIYLILGIFALLISKAYSQDTIITKVGQKIICQNIQVRDTVISYKIYQGTSDSIYTLSKNEILKIRYQKIVVAPIDTIKPIETKVVNTEEPKQKTEVKEINNQPEIDLYVKGQFDAERHYKGYQASSAGIFISALLLSPIIATIPAISASVAPIKKGELNYPDGNLIKDKEYYLGYTDKAKEIKKGKAWTAWCGGTGTFIAISIAASLLIFVK